MFLVLIKFNVPLILIIFLMGWAPVCAAKIPDFDAKAKLKSYVTDNLYRVDDDEKDEFDSEDGPDEQFHDMEGPEDVVVRPGIALDWKWKIAKKRKFTVSLDADYTFHALNSIADYWKYKSELTYDWTRKDEIGIEARYIPDRFRKNLSFDDGGTKVYRAAYYRQVDFTPWYVRKLNKDWQAGGEYKFSRRTYDSPFGYRDWDRHTGSVFTSYVLWDRLKITADAGASTTIVDKSQEFGVKVDRSHDDLLFGLKVDIDFPHKWEAKIGSEYRFRDYSSDEPEDDSHYEQSDERLVFEAELGKWIGKNLFMALETYYTHKISSGEGSLIESEEPVYNELRAGVSINWKFL